MQEVGWQEGSQLPRILQLEEPTAPLAVPAAALPMTSKMSLRDAFNQIAEERISTLELARAPDYIEPPNAAMQCNSMPKEATGLGLWMPFQNRGEQTKRLARMFYDIDKKRGRDSWESVKRELKLPVCFGLPGIGKSRFAVAAVQNLERAAWAAHGKDGETEPCVQALAEAMVEFAWAEKPEDGDSRVRFLQHLVTARRNGRILRIDCSDFVAELTSTTDLNSTLAHLLLADWAAQFTAMDESKSSKADRRTAIYKNLKSLAGTSSTLVEAAAIILGPEAVTSEEGDPPAIVLSLDEVQDIPNLLGLVTELTKLSAVNGVRLLMVTSGVTEAHELKRQEGTSFSIQNITLPLLKQQHVESIFESFRPEGDRHTLTQDMKDAAWWVGGIPRHVEQLLWDVFQCKPCQDALQRLSTSDSSADAKPEIWNTMVSMNAMQWSSLLADLCASLIASYAKHGLDLHSKPEKFQLLRALVVSEWPVQLNTTLSVPEATPLTVKSLQQAKLCYFQPFQEYEECYDEYAFGVVKVPPLLLWSTEAAAKARTLGEVTTSPAIRPECYLTPEENETLAMAVMLDRLRAAKYCSGKPSMGLDELLGMRPTPDCPPKCIPSYLEHQSQQLQIHKDRLEAKLAAPSTRNTAVTQLCAINLGERIALLEAGGHGMGATESCSDLGALDALIQQRDGLDCDLQQFVADRRELLATTLTIPDKLEHSVEEKRLDGPALIERIIEARANSKPAAFLNGRQAPAADAVLVFNELVVFIQEKQSIVARCATASGTTVASVGKGSVNREYIKIATSYQENAPADFPSFVVLYITDEVQRLDEQLPAANCFVFDHTRLRTLLGPLVSAGRARARADGLARMT